MTTILETLQYALFTRRPLVLGELTSHELLAINNDAKHQFEVFLVRLQMTEEEIIRRDANGDNMENVDFSYEVRPSPYSETETEVKVDWKPGRQEIHQRRMVEAEAIRKLETEEMEGDYLNGYST